VDGVIPQLSRACACVCGKDKRKVMMKARYGTIFSQAFCSVDGFAAMCSTLVSEETMQAA